MISCALLRDLLANFPIFRSALHANPRPLPTRAMPSHPTHTCLLTQPTHVMPSSLTWHAFSSNHACHAFSSNHTCHALLTTGTPTHAMHPTPSSNALHSLMPRPSNHWHTHMPCPLPHQSNALHLLMPRPPDCWHCSSCGLCPGCPPAARWQNHGRLGPAHPT